MAIEDDTARPRGRLNTAYWLLLTVLLGLPLITPLLRWSSVACTHDGHLHYHRVAAMAHAWENGIYLTRWLPDLAFGYGYPFFVYREAAPLYAVLLPFLAGLPLPAASNLFYAITILLCGVFMFLWVRDIFGPRPGLVSAVAYMAAPYVLVDALVRGNAPESLALPLFPFLLWVGRRWVLFGSARSFVAGALGLGLLSIGHNISTFIFAPTLLVYLVALAMNNRRARTTDDRQRTTDSGALRIKPSSVVDRFWASGIIRAVLLLALGLGLAFFYTGGALLEMDQVTLEMSTTTRNNDWRFNFASLGEILAPVAAEDPNLVNPPLLFRLGWLPLLLAVAGVTGLIWIKGSDTRAREQRLHIWLMAVGATFYLFMALPVSRWLWEALPLIDFVQFPWRFVGRAALPVAFLAGVPFYWFDRGQWTAESRPATTDDGPQTVDGGRIPDSTTADSVQSAVGGRWSVVKIQESPWRAVFLAFAVGLLILETIPNLYPRICTEEPFPTILTVHNYEHITGLVGVDPEGSYFPRTVRERPAGSPLEADYAAEQTPQRFDVTSLPTTAEVGDISYGRHGVTLTVESPEAFTARYLSFAFPGWSARVDGEPVVVTPEDPTGLITFDVPAGSHEIVVEWGATPLRLVLVGLSALSAVGIALVAWRARRRVPSADGRPANPEANPPEVMPRSEWVVLAFSGVALLGLLWLAGRGTTPLVKAGAPPVEQATTLQGGELRLDGFNLDRDQVPAGETFDIDLAWTAVAPPTVDYQSEIAIVGPDGLAWSQKGTERTRVYEDAAPTRLWTTGEWGWDSREVRVLSGTPPGLYDIVVTLFDKATLAPVTLVDTATGQAAGPTAIIGQIEIVNSNAPPEFDPQYPVDQTFPTLGLRLLGFNQDRADAAPGESVLLTLFWECIDPALCERITLRLVDENGTVIQVWELPAVRDGFTGDEWPAHGRLRGQHLLQLPANMESGHYQFYLDAFPLGELAVVAPDRVFTAPELAAGLGYPFETADGNAVATLVGLAGDAPPTACSSASPLGEACSVSLVWRADAETATSYHVFVHLVDEAGTILAQSDAIPANWTRPTTGWVTGEYIIDTHTLAVPEGTPPEQLSIRAGLYDPDTGERLQTSDSDFAAIQLSPAGE